MQTRDGTGKDDRIALRLDLTIAANCLSEFCKGGRVMAGVKTVPEGVAVGGLAAAAAGREGRAGGDGRRGKKWDGHRGNMLLYIFLEAGTNPTPGSSALSGTGPNQKTDLERGEKLRRSSPDSIRDLKRKALRLRSWGGESLRG
jgi:hypothetical protein